MISSGLPDSNQGVACSGCQAASPRTPGWPGEATSGAVVRSSWAGSKWPPGVGQVSSSPHPPAQEGQEVRTRDLPPAGVPRPACPAEDTGRPRSQRADVVSDWKNYESTALWWPPNYFFFFPEGNRNPKLPAISSLKTTWGMRPVEPSPPPAHSTIVRTPWDWTGFCGSFPSPPHLPLQ